jgi:CRISPR-associated exonuclease Cas4
MPTALLLLALVLGGLGLWLLWRAAAGRKAAGLPRGRVTYADTGAWNRCERPLFSGAQRLTGRPDYLVQQGAALVPVEVKSGPAPRQPHAPHVLQLAAYCLLVEEQEGRAPPYGILKYEDEAFELDYTPALRADLLATLSSMRRDLGAAQVDRSHEQAERCRGCGYREQCDQRLA